MVKNITKYQWSLIMRTKGEAHAYEANIFENTRNMKKKQQRYPIYIFKEVYFFKFIFNRVSYKL